MQLVIDDDYCIVSLNKVLVCRDMTGNGKWGLFWFIAHLTPPFFFWYLIAICEPRRSAQPQCQGAR